MRKTVHIQKLIMKVFSEENQKKRKKNRFNDNF
jgi:hypothetical protein